MPDSPAFTELMKIEQKLDWTLLRKKAEINDALGRSTRVKRTLRVFLSNTVHNQPWQTGGATEKDGDVQMSEEKKAEGENKEGGEKKEGEGDAGKKEGEGEKKGEGSSTAGVPPGVDVKTGKGVAGWVLRIEGRLLDVSKIGRTLRYLTSRLATTDWTSRSASSQRSCALSSSSSTTARRRRSPRATSSSGTRTQQPSLWMASRSSAAGIRTSRRALFCT